MNFRQYLKEHIVLLDGGMGTLLQARGLSAGQASESWSLSHPDEVEAVHRAYFEAGANVVNTNTFGVNALKYEQRQLRELVTASVELARRARDGAAGTQPRFIALDIGPTGRLLKPLGDLDFEQAVSAFAAVVRAGAEAGADLIFIETMADSYETKAALLAVRENCDLPVLVSNAYGADGKLMTGADPQAMTALLEGLGADAVGANCSLGPRQLAAVVDSLCAAASVPVLFKPNAGLPRTEAGRTVYDITAEQFAAEAAAAVDRGVRLVGGCCGTTPAHISALRQALEGKRPLPLTDKGRTVISSGTHAVSFDGQPVLIGERINPTGKKLLKQALREGNMDYVLSEALSQQESGAHVLDVNVGLPELCEAELLPRVVCELQAVCDLPLQIDTADPAAMEAALRRCNGKPLINSVNGKEESLAAVLPLAKKYGGVVIALTLDEQGIPATAEGRLAIARRILARAQACGIARKDVVFDTLAMAVSADPAAAGATLGALRRIREELGCHTSLGLSNVSFGLPNRDAVNGTFFAMALEAGLSAAILNPHSADMMRTYFTWRALRGLDENFTDYIEKAESFTACAAAPAPAASGESYTSELQAAIGKGRKERAAVLTRQLLGQTEPMEVVNGHIIPALNAVGVGFEQKRIYLPQLLMSAEAAQAAFAEIRAVSAREGGQSRGHVVLATVEGDIHDIGKNIVRLLLENYGFTVHDLGRDVPPDRVLECVRQTGAPLVGLSALMTTTVPAMEATIALLRAQAPGVRVVVGGAVLTAEYAAAIGADRYAADAMETVRYAEEILG